MFLSEYKLNTNIEYTITNLLTFNKFFYGFMGLISKESETVKKYHNSQVFYQNRIFAFYFNLKSILKPSLDRK